MNVQGEQEEEEEQSKTQNESTKERETNRKFWIHVESRGDG